MTLVDLIDDVNAEATKSLDASVRGSLGQFFTPAPISVYMASLFENISGSIRLLDPGCGPASLTAAFIEESVTRGEVNSLDVTLYDIEERLSGHIENSISQFKQFSNTSGLEFTATYIEDDFILKSGKESGLFEEEQKFTHVIANPPYKKIATNSPHRKALRARGIETVNLYSGFLALAIQDLKYGGEMVAIVPRSFCNGPYYQPFREFLLKEVCIKTIHIFDSRTNAFQKDDVLQENVIIHFVKGYKQDEVEVRSTPSSDFYFCDSSNSVTAPDMTSRIVEFSKIVSPHDPNSFIHIAANQRDQDIVDKLGAFQSNLGELSIQVSTGPVVDFRMREALKESIDHSSCPLLFPVHLQEQITWPLKSKKPNAIDITEKTRSSLWPQKGCYLLVKRLSSKEENRRIVARVFESDLSGELIGFDNKLNIFHLNKSGLEKNIVYGLFVYLNSTLVDKYYRLFGGHTQVNATDLRGLPYPSSESLERLGMELSSLAVTQQEIDQIMERELVELTGVNSNPLDAQTKVDQGIEILKALGLPREQQNERSALTLLALLGLEPNGSWDQLTNDLIGVTPIMDWCKTIYGKPYAPNTRETFRRQTLHQFIDGGLCLYNPDKPDRPVNSPKACYQVTPEVYELLQHFGKESWGAQLKAWLDIRTTLVEQYAMVREKEMIPLTLPNGTSIKLSPGIHSQLIHDIVVSFGPIFAPASEVIYLGDTGAKEDFFDRNRLEQLGVTVDRKGKLPDVVLYWPEKDWLLLIESVTSHGPVDGKRHNELTKLFKNSKAGLVYVTAFPDRKTMGKYVADISWETEVWVSEDPTHMIHFNGDRFLGPHSV